MKMQTWKILLTASLLSFGVACGDDDGMADAGPTPDATTPDATTPDATTPDAEAPDAELPAENIVEIATANPDLSILVSALGRTGLDETLAGAGPFTVFAPPNAAFAGLDLEAFSDEELTTILLNHVIVGAAVGSGAIPATADNGADLTLIFNTAAAVSVNGATVTTPDIAASNGIIHVVDAVMVPATIADLAGYAGLTSLAGALDSAGLLSAVQDPEATLTVFAPTNDAFTAAGEVPADALANILLYHVVNGAVDSASVPALANTLATNEWDNNLTLLFDTSAGVVINGGPAAIAGLTDIKATNGIVHVIDGVLLPMNALDAAVAAGLTGLTGAVGLAAPIDGDVTVASTLSEGAGPFTVFAPTNEAFAAIVDTVAGLSPEQVRDVLLYHVLALDPPVLSTDLADGNVPTVLGPNVAIIATPPSVNGESIVIPDINVTNGVVHVIDGVLLPPT